MSRPRLRQQALFPLGFFTFRDLKAISRMAQPRAPFYREGSKLAHCFLQSRYALEKKKPSVTHKVSYRIILLDFEVPEGKPVALRTATSLRRPVQFRLTGNNPSTCPYPLHCDVGISGYGSPLPGTDQRIHYISCYEGVVRALPRHVR